jgi:hypothetical protein
MNEANKSETTEERSFHDDPNATAPHNAYDLQHIQSFSHQNVTTEGVERDGMLSGEIIVQDVSNHVLSSSEKDQSTV